MTTANRLVDRPSPPSRIAHVPRYLRADVLLAVAAFLGLCLAVLMRAPQMLEPDDYAYRASIVALSHGHILLSNAQYLALEHQLGSASSAVGPGGGGAIQQWDHLANGLWISEKNPGYPFLAVPFQWLGALRLTPLFYGALGCLGLWFGGRRWLGRWGGAFAVVLYCTSGAALAFAWRATMETFTDASLVAAGAGALLWTLLATDAAQHRRCLVGLAGILALVAATFTRYTDVVALGVAILAIIALARRVGIAWRTLQIWTTGLVLSGLGILGFDQYAYGAWDKTGYAAGEITFSLSALSPNLQHMPAHLVRAMPMLVLGLGACGWIAARAIGARVADPAARAARRRDAVVAVALGAGWLGFWGLYLCYGWTAQMSARSNGAIHVIRFYLPALGLIALLAAWPLVRLLRLRGQLGAWLVAAVLAALVLAGGWSYQNLVTNSAGPGGGPGGGTPGLGAFPGGGTPPQGAGPSGATGGVRPAGGSGGLGVPGGAGSTGSTGSSGSVG